MYKFKLTSLPFDTRLLNSVATTSDYYYASKFPISQFLDRLHEFTKLNPYTYIKTSQPSPVITEVVKVVSKTSVVYGSSTSSKLQRELKLNEARRADVVKSSKDVLGSQSRYKARTTIKDSEVTYMFDAMALIRNKKVRFRFNIRGYVVTIEINGVVAYLKNAIAKHKLTYDNIRKFITAAIDRTDIYVDCTCPDFKYRMAYVATTKGFKADTPETRPARITNPQNRGGICKHIAKLLGNKKWIRKYVSLINVLIKLYPNILK